MRNKLLAIYAMGFLAAPMTASASLIGDTVTCSGSFNCSPTSATVIDPGVEFNLVSSSTGATLWEIDLGANSVRMQYVDGNIINVGLPDIFVNLDDLDWVGDPTGYITGITNFATDVESGINVSDVTFTDHSVRIGYGESEWRPDQYLSFDLVTNHAVPEPATLALIGIGLAGMGFARRRKSA